MKGFPAAAAVQLLFLTVVLLALPPATSATVAVRADLTHVDSGRGFTKRELLHRMVARSRTRAARLQCPSGRGPARHTAAVTAPVVHSISGEEDVDTEYLIHFSIGTPTPQAVALTLDTGSDLIWTQCNCQVCFDQPFPVLDFTASKTINGVLCSDPVCVSGELPVSGCTLKNGFCFYVYSYGDQSVTTGLIVEDNFTFKPPNGKATGGGGGGGGQVVVPEIRFGCGMYNTGIFKSNESGIAGFGRGPLSLPSQLKVGRFSYCFTPTFESRSSPVFLGTPDDLKKNAMGPILSTPFARSPAGGHSSLYYLSLKGVTVGKTRLPFNESTTFAVKESGSGGTMIDSGTGITTFPQAVFDHLVQAFVSQVPLPVASGTNGVLCFASPEPKKVAVPKLVFHLEGADWVLPRESYVVDIEDDANKDDGELCVVVSSGGESDMTIIGNFQQHNTHIVYDLANNKMIFVPAQCDKL